MRCFLVPILSFVSLPGDGVAAPKRPGAKERPGVNDTHSVNCDEVSPVFFLQHQKLLNPSHLRPSVAAAERRYLWASHVMLPDKSKGEMEPRATAVPQSTSSPVPGCHL